MYRDITFLPLSFVATLVGLELTGRGPLHAAGLGGQYSITESYDPVEY